MPSKIPFTNNKGRTIELIPEITIRQMAELGLSIKITKPEEPLGDGWYRENGSDPHPQPEKP